MKFSGPRKHNVPVQAEAPNLAEEVLRLPVMGYPLTPLAGHARREYAAPIVDLLVRLHAAGIDRTAHPVLATFVSMTRKPELDTLLDIQEDHIAQTTSDLAAEQGLLVAVSTSWLSGISGQEIAAEQRATPAKLALDGIAQAAQDLHYNLAISRDIDESSYGADSFASTYSYQGYAFTVSIVPPAE